MSDTYVYQIGDNLYINLTSRCSNSCTFCVRDQSAQYEGYSLFLKEGEPAAQQVTVLIGDPKRYNEIVFCGYGEPTFRTDAIKEICDFVHARGGKTRLNTNGQGNLINGRNIVPELKGRADGINISLNAPTEEEYNAVCRPQLAGAYDAVKEFARECKRAGINCWFSVVDCIGSEKVEACRRIADEVGIPLRVREMINNKE